MLAIFRVFHVVTACVVAMDTPNAIDLLKELYTDLPVRGLMLLIENYLSFLRETQHVKF